MTDISVTKKIPPPCRNGALCFKKDCWGLHPNKWCEKEVCTGDKCENRHARWCRDSPQPDSSASSSSSKIKECHDKNCPLRHTQSFCTQDDSCVSYNCPNRHSKTDRKCREDFACFDVTCPRLHSFKRLPICPNGSLCKNIASCAALHPQPPIKVKFLESVHQNFWKQVLNMLSKIFKPRGKSTPIDLLSMFRQRLCNAMTSHDHVIIEAKKKIIEHQKATLENVCFDSKTEETNSETLEVLKTAFREVTAQENSFLQAIDRALRSFVDPNRRILISQLNSCFNREIFRLTKNRLPALALRYDVEKLVLENQVVVVRGQTGSGKSTQLPQYLSELAFLTSVGATKVICTQPRKIAATSLAKRVAFEYAAGVEQFAKIGPDVGYRVGGGNGAIKHTKIEYVTEDSFLNSVLSGRIDYKDIYCVVVDEAHERNISTDILLGILKSKVQEYKHLKVIITSATLDPKVFSTYYNSCLYIDIPGKTFPVDIIYSPPASENTSIFTAVVEKAIEIHRKEPISSGDILCFLTGQDEVEKAKIKFLETPKLGKPVKVLTAYGKQSPEDQQELFAPAPNGTRKIIFATDVAETSVTINGVRFVVDSGVKKDTVFDPKRNMTSLQVMSISQSSAVQRKGRAGRTSSGTCIRLYSQQDYDQMPAGVVPELLRVPLALTVVNLLAMKIDAADFNWLNPPAIDAINNAVDELSFLGAIVKAKATVGTKYELTNLGKFIGDTQLDPGWAKMIFAGCGKGYGEAAVKLAAIASASDIFFWHVAMSDTDKKAKADAAKSSLASSWGDLVTMYNVYTEYEDMIQNKRKPTFIPPPATNMKSTIFSDDDDEDSKSTTSSSDVESVVSDVTIASTTITSISNNNKNNKNNNNSNNNNNDIANINDLVDLEEASEFDDASLELIDIVKDDEERKMADEYVKSNKESIGAWLRNNFISQKAMSIIGSNARMLLKLTKQMQSIWGVRTQDIKPKEDDLCVLLFNGMFLNLAIRISDNMYRVVRSNIVATIHPGSVLTKFKELPNAICYQSILRTRAVMLVNPMQCDANWLNDVSPEFLKSSQGKIEIEEYKSEKMPISLLKAFAGKMGVKLREFEQQFDCFSQILYDEGVIRAWASGNKLKAIEAEINSRMETLREEARKEVEEVSINESTRVLVGVGGEIVNILSAGEYCAVIFRGLASRESANKLKKKIENDFGSLSSFTILEDQSNIESGKLTAYSMFNNADVAKRVQMTLNNEVMDGKNIDAIPGGVPKPTSFKDIHAQLRVSYSLGVSKGEASLTFANVDTANVAITTLRKSYPGVNVSPVGPRQSDASSSASGKEITKKFDRPAPFVSRDRLFLPLDNVMQDKASTYLIQIQLKGLGPQVTELDLKAPLKRENIVPTSVKVKREIQPQEQQQQQQQTLLEYAVAMTNVIPYATELQPTMTEFSDEKRMLIGFIITYPTPDDTQRAFESLRGQQLDIIMPHDNKRVQMEVEFFGTFSLHMDLYKARKRDLETVITKAGLSGVAVKKKQNKDGQNQSKVVFYLKAESLPALLNVQKELEYALKCFLYSHQCRNTLFSFFGRHLLKKVSNFSAYLHWDNKTKLIRIYGTDNEQQAACVILDDLISQMKDLLIDVPFNLTKSGIEQYKKKAPALQNIPGVEYINTANRIIHATGTPEGIKVLETQLEGMLVKPKNKKDNEDDCGVCFGEFENPFTLCNCTHTGCLACLKSMIGETVYLSEPPHIPIKCNHTDGCGDLLVLSDLRSLSTADFWEKLIDTSLQKFLKLHPEFIRCPKVGCTQVIKVPPMPKDLVEERHNGGHIINCDICMTSYCLSCSNDKNKPIYRHPGDLCSEMTDEFAIIQKHRVKICELFNMKCPRCHSFFGGWEGCMAVTCTCGCGFCGICFLDCGTDAHQHVLSCNKKGGYFLSSGELSILHRERNIKAYHAYLNTISDIHIRKAVEKACEKDVKTL